MGLFDNKYKKCVYEFEKKFYEKYAMHLTNTEYIAMALSLESYKLGQELEHLGCKKTDPYLALFESDINARINKLNGARDKQQSICDDFVKSMDKVVKSSASSKDKKARIAQILKKAEKYLNDDMSIANIRYIAQEMESRIDHEENAALEDYVSDRLGYYEKTAKTTRAQAIVRAEAEQTLMDLENNKRVR